MQKHKLWVAQVGLMRNIYLKNLNKGRCTLTPQQPESQSGQSKVTLPHDDSTFVCSVNHRAFSTSWNFRLANHLSRTKKNLIQKEDAFQFEEPTQHCSFKKEWPTPAATLPVSNNFWITEFFRQMIVSGKDFF